ncbi:radical SAM protein [bacterium]|nr:radical SAM protein [bacterium]
MHVLLFNPWITDFAAFDLWTRPLNLLRLGAVLRQYGCTVELFDCMDRFSPWLKGLRQRNHRMNALGCGHYYFEIIPNPDLLSFVPRQYKRFGIPKQRVREALYQMEEPNCIVVSCMMTYWYPGAFEAISLLREVFPTVPIVLGGVYPTLCFEHAKTGSGADWICRGPHWFSIAAEILSLVEQPIPMQGDHATWIEPAYDLLQNESAFPLLTSVGCPFHCTYCATHSIWPKYVSYPVQQVVDSIERLVKEYGATDLAFYDDALLIHKKSHFLPMMEEIVRGQLPVRFHTPNAVHVRELDARTAQVMKKAGFQTIRLALETVAGDWQQNTGAKVFTSEYLEAMDSLKAAGFSSREIGTYIMYGLPNQPLDNVVQACNVVHHAGSEIKIAMYSPVPGTSLFQETNHGFVFDPTQDPLLQNNSLAPWRTGQISYAEYQDLKRYVADRNQKLNS